MTLVVFSVSLTLGRAVLLMYTKGSGMNRYPNSA